MKRFALILAAILLTISGFSQKEPKFTEDDAKQFYRTIIGDYTLAVNDSTSYAVHFTPIWEKPDNRFQWMYLEVNQGKEVVMQKVLEVQPKTETVFRVYVHDLKNPKQFAGKWGNRNYFDGFNESILKGKKKISFVKTADFSYQTDWNRCSALTCFQKGDLLHFKFVQQDERFYIKRMPKDTNRILGYQGLKELTD